MSTTIIETYSDQDMLCPGSWENGYKEGVIESWGDAERAASHRRNGDWTGPTFTFRRSDTDRKIREDFASSTRRYWPDPLEIKMTDDPTRDVLGEAYTVFVGLITGLRFPSDSPLSVDVELGDIIGQRLLSDQMQVPWRKIGDGFLDQLIEVSESLDRGTPEPRIYGIYTRVPLSTQGSPAIDAPSHHGFCVLPTYLGIMSVSATPYHVWLVAGHAVKYIPTIRVDSIDKIADEGVDWLVPHHGGHGAAFTGAPYNDFTSSTYGNTRRYTLVFGLVTDMGADPDAMTDPDACASGHRQLTVAVEGVEDAGDTTGDLILDRIQQYKHWTINDVVNNGPNSYQSGLWLTTPSWSLFGTTVPMIDEDSFDVCSAIAAERLPEVVQSPAVQAGYIGAYVIGAKAGDRLTVKHWLAEWNRSCGVIWFVSHLGQITVKMLHPTQAAKDAAPLLTDVTEILEGGFGTEPQFNQQVLSVPFKADYEHGTGVWTLEDVFTNDTEIAKYETTLDSETQTYPAAPGITANYHMARMEGLQFAHPPRLVLLEQTIGPDPLGNSLGYLDIGDYVRYRCFDAVSNAYDEIRLGWILAHQVQVGRRVVRIKVIDVEDLIDFDAPPAEASAGSPQPGAGSPGSPSGALDPDEMIVGPQEDITCS